MDTMQPALIAFLAFVAYVAAVGVVWRATGTRYDHLVDSRSTILRGIVLPIGLGALLLVAVTTWQGWWGAALWPDAGGPAWTWAVPVLFGVVALLNVAAIDWRSARRTLLPLLVLGTLLVGFAEELLTRGMLAVGLRDSGATVLGVWLGTSVLFALLHGLNALFGQSVRQTATQVLMAFLAGSALFVSVTVSGSLILAMALHALWDFGTLGVLATGARQRPLTGLLGLGTLLLGLVAALVVALA
jgi:membrane protease YdiL (CAAX protease family)